MQKKIQTDVDIQLINTARDLSTESTTINKNNTEDPFTQELHHLLDTNIRTADSLLNNLIGRGLPLTKYHYYNEQPISANITTMSDNHQNDYIFN